MPLIVLVAACAAAAAVAAKDGHSGASVPFDAREVTETPQDDPNMGPKIGPALAAMIAAGGAEGDVDLDVILGLDRQADAALVGDLAERGLRVGTSAGDVLTGRIARGRLSELVADDRVLTVETGGALGPEGGLHPGGEPPTE